MKGSWRRVAAAAACLGLALLAGFSGPAYAGKPAESGEPGEIEVRKNIPYYSGEGADRYAHRLDLYLPKDRKKDRKGVPVLMFVYGGGLTRGNKEMSTYVRVGEAFAAQGLATAVINYRLTPKVVHPGHVQDVARAFAWVHEHIAEYGGRPDRVFVSGHSAGGHLVALLATDPSYLQAVGRSFADIKGVIPISATYTIGTGPGAYRSPFGIDPDVVSNASPINHVAGHHPAFLILYGDGDMASMHADSEKMVKALAAVGTEVEIHEMPAHDHMQMVLGIPVPGDPVAPAVLDFIRRH
jgi:acetyl esterase/lipase